MKQVVDYVTVVHGYSQRRACRLTQQHRSTQRKVLRLDPRTARRQRMDKIVLTRLRFGYQRVHILLKREGFTEDAGTGLTTQSAAKLATDFKRSGFRHRNCALGLETSRCSAFPMGSSRSLRPNTSQVFALPGSGTLIRRKVHRSRDEARLDVFDYLEMFYSPKRKHVRNGMLSPVEFEKQQKI